MSRRRVVAFSSARCLPSRMGWKNLSRLHRTAGSVSHDNNRMGLHMSCMSLTSGMQVAHPTTRPSLVCLPQPFCPVSNVPNNGSAPPTPCRIMAPQHARTPQTSGSYAFYDALAAKKRSAADLKQELGLSAPTIRGGPARAAIARTCGAIGRKGTNDDPSQALRARPRPTARNIERTQASYGVGCTGQRAPGPPDLAILSPVVHRHLGSVTAAVGQAGVQDADNRLIVLALSQID